MHPVDDENTAEELAAKILSWEKIIAELCASAPDDIVKQCLRNYDAVKSTKELKVHFNTHCLNKEPISKTLNYLGWYPSKVNKSELIDMLLLRVKNFFPDICGFCKQEYCIKIDNVSLLACSSCGQECHNECLIENFAKLGLETGDYLKLLQLPGIHFLCNSCEEQTILNIETNKNGEQLDNTPTLSNNSPPFINDTKSKSCKQSESTDNIVLSPPTPVSESIHTRDSDIQQYISPSVIVENAQFPSSNDSDDDEWIVAGNVSKKVHRTDFMKRQSEDNKKSNQRLTSESVTTQSEADNKEKPKNICKFLRKGSCKHGMSGKKDGGCSFFHPKLCNRFIQHGTRQPRGCNKGNSCKFFHPQMCMNSLRKQECFDQHCRFNHIKGTKRVQQTSENGSKHNIQPPTSHQQPPPPPPRDTTHHQHNNTPNQNFLELVQLLKSDIDMKIQALSAQLQQMMFHQQNQHNKVQPNHHQIRMMNPHQLPHQNPQNVTLQTQNHLVPSQYQPIIRTF